MRRLFMLIGAAVLAAGLLFMGQGFGFIRWPASSFMVGETEWIYYGAGIAFAGVLLILTARR